MKPDQMGGILEQSVLPSSHSPLGLRAPDSGPRRESGDAQGVEDSLMRLVGWDESGPATGKVQRIEGKQKFQQIGMKKERCSRERGPWLDRGEETVLAMTKR
jgi:hypothetical protein